MIARLRVAWWRLCGFLRGHRADLEMDAELDFHLEMETQALLRSGMNPRQARSEALRRFGGEARVREIYRETRGLPAMELFWKDIQFGWRMLRRNPGSSAVAVLCLALGIGAATAVFSWIEGVLLRPFPLVAHQERMMAIAGTERGVSGAPGTATDISWPDFQDLARNCRSCETFIAEHITGTTLSIGDRAERVTGSVVSANYFDALGVHPVLGGGFEPSEELGRNAHPVVVISYRMWQQRFHGDPAVIGKTQMLNGMPHTIVGVAPDGFYGTFVGYYMQFWVPASMLERFYPGGYIVEDRAGYWIEGFVRLKPGVTAAQAQQEISAVAKRLEIAYPSTNRGRGVRLFPLWRTPFNNAGTLFPMLSVALVVVCFVLLIACANVGNLLLVKAFGRRHEMTVRLAVGAGRGRLLRQLLTEGMLLSGISAVCGLLLANWCRNLLPLLLPQRAGIVMRLPGELDWRVLLLSAAVCVVATVVAGLAPALQNSKLDLVGALKAETGGVVGGGRRALVRWSLIVLQISLSFVLLTGAVLLLESLRAMRSLNPGFATRGVQTTSIDLTSAGYDPARAKDFEDALADHLQELTGVQSVAFARMTPLSNGVYPTARILVEGYDTAPDELPTADFNTVSPGYFGTMGIDIVSGREFTRADNQTAPLVAVVNEPMAAQYWRGRDPVGDRMQVNGKWMRVVGVARISKYRTLTEPAKPFFYVNIRQNAVGQNLHIRTELSTATMAKLLAREVHRIDGNLAAGELISMREQVDRTTGVQRAAAVILGVFGALALVLATVGIYGVMAYTVKQRTREMGLRMALGAEGADLLRLILTSGLWLTGAGVLLGGGCALLLTRLMGTLLYQVSPRDPLAFGAALATMLAAGLSACLIPAWRAARVDPLRALRE